MLHVGLLVVTIWLEHYRSHRCWWQLEAPAVTNTYMIFSSDIIQNRGILIPANPDPPGKCPLKRREWIDNIRNM